MVNSSHSFHWQPIVKLAVLLASLGYAFPAQANSGSVSNWQALCQQYLPASACAAESPVESSWLATPNTSLVAQNTALADKVPTLPAGTPESSVNCFMRNVDGSLLDLTRLCNATSSHPLFAQISVTRSVVELPIDGGALNVRSSGRLSGELKE